MTIFQTILQKIEGLPAGLANWFTTHGAAIHTVIAGAQEALGIAIAGVTAEGAVGAAASLAKVSGALATASTFVTAEASSANLTGQANAIAALTTGLVDSGDIGIKSSATQASVDAAVAKVQSVIGAMVTAAAAVPSATA